MLVAQSQRTLVALAALAAALSAAVLAVAVLAGQPRLAALLLAVAAIAVGAIRYPGVLLAVYLVAPPVFKAAVQPLLPVDLTVLLALGCAPQGLVLLADLQRGRVERRPMAGITLWCLFAVLVWVGVAWAPDRLLALENAVYWIGLGAIPLLSAYRVARDQRHVSHFLRTLLLAAAAVALAGLPEIFGEDRLAVFGSNHISTSRAVLLLPVIAVSFTSEPFWIRVAGLALYPLGLAVALATGSRGPLLAAAALGGVWVAQMIRDRRVDRTAVICGVLTVASVATVLAAQSLPRESQERMSDLVGFATTGTGDVNIQVRLELFRTAVAAFVAHPLAGLGTAGFQAVIAGTPIAAAQYPHDIVLQFAAEYGIIGLALLAASLWLFLGRRDLRGPAWTSVRAVFWLYFLSALVSSDILENRLMWGAMLLVMVAPEVAPEVARTRPTKRARPDAAPSG